MYYGTVKNKEHFGTLTTSRLISSEVLSSKALQSSNLESLAP